MEAKPDVPDGEIESNSDSSDSDVEEWFAQVFPSTSTNKNYTILSVGDIYRRLIDDATSEVCTAVPLAKDEAIHLLLHYKWSVASVIDAWVSDEIEIREKLEMWKNPIRNPYPVKTIRTPCQICKKLHTLDVLIWTKCDCTFCGNCLARFIHRNASGSSKFRCPNPRCSEIFGQSIIDKVAKERNYARYIVRSFVKKDQSIKWCPAPGCNYAIKIDSSSSNFDVTCINNHNFCWNCLGESHRPVNCDTVSKWMSAISDPETRNSTRCYNKWTCNDVSKVQALSELEAVRRKLREVENKDLNFVVETWEEIAKCRQILKWTSVYEYYYLAEYDDVKMKFFDYSYKEAVSALERLHCMVEEKVWKAEIINDHHCHHFIEYRKEVIDMTSLTRKFFRNLVDGWESDLSCIKSVVAKLKILKID